jgi:hypothetical protein
MELLRDFVTSSLHPASKQYLYSNLNIKLYCVTAGKVLNVSEYVHIWNQQNLHKDTETGLLKV